MPKKEDPGIHVGAPGLSSHKPTKKETEHPAPKAKVKTVATKAKKK